MEDIFNQPEPKKLNKKIFVIGILIGAVGLGLAIWWMSLKPSMDDQIAKILEGSYREGSPEFAELTKDIICSDDRTIQSPMATGTISMFINGKVRNKGTHTINALELNVGVVDQFNKVLKEKRILVIPTQVPRLAPGEIIPVNLSLDNFAKDDDRAAIRWRVTAIRVEQ